MERQTIALEKDSAIIVESVSGDLRVRGWAKAELDAKCGCDELQVRVEDSKVYVSCADDLILSIPASSPLTVLSADDDVDLRGLAGAVNLESVGGTLDLRQVADVTVGTVATDLIVRRASGLLQVQSVGADASLRDVQAVEIGTIGSDLHVRGASGDLTATAGGEVVLFLSPQPGTTLRATAGGELLLRLPPDADVELHLTGGGPEAVRVDWPGVPAETGTSREVTLGSGAAKAHLAAGGDLLVTGDADAWQDMADFDFDVEVDSLVGEWVGLAPEIEERLHRRTEAAARRAEATARRVQARVERKMAKVQEKVGRRFEGSAHRHFPPMPPFPPAPMSEPVSDEERMTILRLLEEKKITLEEAEKLLSALE